MKLADFVKCSFPVLLMLVACSQVEGPALSSDELYRLFRDPPAEARPFVRWWWNGDCIEVDELERELDIMHAAGIGGVEINPIAMPPEADPAGHQCYEWLSPPWNQRVKATVEMARERNMIVDLIMGSGWPFGGEFLKEDQFLQGVGIRKLSLEGPREVSLKLEEVWQLPGRDFGSYRNPDAPEPELFFLQMIPHGAEGETDLVDLMDRVAADGTVRFMVPAGKHDLYIGTFQKAYRSVMHGAPGSAGPVVDHYNAGDVRAYMDKLAGALEAVLGGRLGDHLRALFCDSIELSGANITDDLFDEFLQRRGYDLRPFLPLVYYHPYRGYTDTLHYDEAFNEEIRRIRYDFNKTLVELFLERFTLTFDEWANEHGMQSRYQAYGMPWLMGMLDGYRIVDIPESNNWLYSANAKVHGYWIWNKYTSSAAHLSGAPVVSCEAMTNTRGVFRMPLNMVKKNDDFNFITGINHSVLHGYNYSPPEAGFPGWVRYGAYFSDQNTWWPYFRHWADYNARLSFVFQNTKPVTDIAVMTPTADIWKQWGLYRQPFHLYPWYNHELWEAFSREGYMCDYINEGVLQRATAVEGQMQSGQGRYQLVIVSGAQSIEPQTAEAIRDLAARGIQFLFVDHLPGTSPSYVNLETNDYIVGSLMNEISSLSNVRLIEAPGDPSGLPSWVDAVIREHKLEADLEISPVSDRVYTLKHRHGKDEIYFFSNQDEQSARSFEVSFTCWKRTAWIWDPHSGEKYILPAEEDGQLEIHLQPLESILVFMTDQHEGPEAVRVLPDENTGRAITTAWQIDFNPAMEEPFSTVTTALFDFGGHPDPRIASFAGTAVYRTSFSEEDVSWDFLDLGRERHVTEVLLNGENMGLKWYGRHLYRIPDGILKSGENSLEIRYTTTLANYANSLHDNKVAKRWIDLDEPESMGLARRPRLLRAL